MKNKSQAIDEIFLIIIGILFLLSGVLIGTPLNNNTQIFFFLLPCFFIIYRCLKKKIQKEKSCIKNGMDYFVILLFVSSCIPFFFKSYATYQGAIETIFRYATIMCFYFIVRDIAIDRKKCSYLILFLILSGILVFIFGLDHLTGNRLEILTKAVGGFLAQNPDSRFMGSFGYANSAAAFFGVLSFISLGSYLEQEENQKGRKIIYAGSLFLFLVAILLSYSRFVWLFFAISFLCYFIWNKEKRKEIIKISIIEGIACFLYYLIYVSCSVYQNNIVIWLGVFVIALFVGILTFLSHKKIMALGIAFVTVLMVLFLNIDITQKGDLVLFTNQKADHPHAQFIYHIQPSTSYHLQFLIEAKVKYKNIDAYCIKIEEKDEQNDTVQTTYIEFGEFSGWKEINLTTTETTNKFYLSFQTNYPLANQELRIQTSIINGEEVILNYRYLPKVLIDKIKNTTVDTKSAWERSTLIKNGIELGLQHWMTGIGGDGWRYLQYSVQDYAYSIAEVHSYPVEIWVEFGIVGLIAILGIGILFLKKVIQERKTKDSLKIAIMVALLFILCHCCIDFDLSFFHIQIVVISLLACLMTEKTTKVSTGRYYDILLGIILIALLGWRVNYQYVERIENEKDHTIEQIKNQLEKEPFENNSRKINKMMLKVQEELTKETLAEQIENMHFIYEITEKKVRQKPLFIEENLRNNELILTIYKQSKEIEEQYTEEQIAIINSKFLNLLNENFERIEENLKQKEKIRFTEDKVEASFQEIQRQKERLKQIR